MEWDSLLLRIMQELLHAEIPLGGGCYLFEQMNRKTGNSSIVHRQYKTPSPCAQLKESTDSNPKRGRLSVLIVHVVQNLSRGWIAIK